MVSGGGESLSVLQISSPLLVHFDSSSLPVYFDSTLPLILACDASEFGIGAVLTYRMPDGGEQPIRYVS